MTLIPLIFFFLAGLGSIAAVALLGDAGWRLNWFHYAVLSLIIGIICMLTMRGALTLI